MARSFWINGSGECGLDPDDEVLNSEPDVCLEELLTVKELALYDRYNAVRTLIDNDEMACFMLLGGRNRKYFNGEEYLELWCKATHDASDFRYWARAYSHMVWLADNGYRVEASFDDWENGALVANFNIRIDGMPDDKILRVARAAAANFKE